MCLASPPLSYRPFALGTAPPFPQSPPIAALPPINLALSPHPSEMPSRDGRPFRRVTPSLATGERPRSEHKNDKPTPGVRIISEVIPGWWWTTRLKLFFLEDFFSFFLSRRCPTERLSYYLPESPRVSRTGLHLPLPDLTYEWFMGNLSLLSPVHEEDKIFIYGRSFFLRHFPLFLRYLLS